MEQLETMEGSEQRNAASGYQQNGYRLEVGPVALRAAETLIRERGTRISDGPTESLPPPDGETCPPPVNDETVTAHPTKRQEVDQPPRANVYTDPKHHTVSLLLDDTTANLVIYAVRVLVADSESHAREVRLVGATLPSDSYGAANRHAIATRHERVAARLRVLERNYRAETSG